ncbi:MAG: polysaccharide biosynthesis/export family protein [Acidobacteriota bacterium]
MKNSRGPVSGPRRRAEVLFSLGLILSILPAFGIGQDAQEASLPVIDYRIGTRDLLQITIFEHAELNQTVRVSEDGSVTLVLLGKVAVSGLTAQDLEKKLVALLKEKYINDPQVTVFIQEYQRVSILGAVGRPGQYEIVGPTNLLQIISQAGGMTTEAANELYIYRDEPNGRKTRLSVNIRDLTINGKYDLNVTLQPKDVIFIPADQTLTVFVYGEVRNPGALQYKASKKITLLQAIAQAGGPTEWASRSKVTITRKNPQTGKEIKIPVNLKNIISNKLSDIILEDGDVVIIP